MNGKTYKVTLEEAIDGLFNAIAEALDEIKNAVDALTEKQKAENEYKMDTSREPPFLAWLKESMQSAIIEGSLCWTDIDKAGKYVWPDFDKIVEDLYTTIKRKLEATGITQSGLPKRIEAAIYDAISQSYSETLHYLEVGEIAENLCVVIEDYVREVIVEIVGKKAEG